MFDILKDIRSGALPVSEIPGFVAWAVGKSPWFWLLVGVVIGGVAIRLFK
jgi:hypothetical protein